MNGFNDITSCCFVTEVRFYRLNGFNDITSCCFMTEVRFYR